MPLAFIGCGVISLLFAGALLMKRPELLATYHYNQYIISVTHLFVLGWITSVVFGATYQLAPVALEVELFSPKLAGVHLFLHVVGVAGMVALFWQWNLKSAVLFGGLVASGVGLFVYNLSRTLMKIQSRNVVAIGIASSLFWLSVTIAAGLLLVVSKQFGIAAFDPVQQMHAHAHAGVLGFFVILIVTVSYKLIPMFVLSDLVNPQRAIGTVWILNIATLGLGISILLGLPTKVLFAALAVLGLALYGWEMLAILKARKRRQLDWGVKYFLTGVALLVPVSALGLTLSIGRVPLNALTGQMENLYGLLALGGVVTLALIGMLYKIIPFLVWYSRYSSEIGRRKVPSLAELYSKHLQVAGYWSFLGGFVLLCVATQLGHTECVRVAAGVWFVSLALFAVNFTKICLHLRRGSTSRFPIPRMAKGVS